MLQLMAFVNEERKKYTIYPPAEDVFSWTLCCPIQKVMLVQKINVETNIINFGICDNCACTTVCGAPLVLI